MLTEQEAKTKWCPMARVLVTSDDVNGTGNRTADMDGLDCDNPKQARCIGSDCMMWRSIDQDRYRLAVNGETSKTWPSGSGFCGLAASHE